MVTFKLNYQFENAIEVLKKFTYHLSLKSRNLFTGYILVSTEELDGVNPFNHRLSRWNCTNLQNPPIQQKKTVTLEQINECPRPVQHSLRPCVRPGEEESNSFTE